MEERRRAARSSSPAAAFVPFGMDAAACGLQNQAPLSFVENSVDNTPVKGFASGLSATLDRRVAARVSNERGASIMKTKRNLSASIPNETRKTVYARDGYRCALCDDTHGLQIHHIVHRSCGGNDTPCNLITLCWRCHAEAHGTWVAERHAVRPPHTAEERYAAYRMLQDEYEQLCVEYVSDYYAERGEEWWPYK